MKNKCVRILQVSLFLVAVLCVIAFFAGCDEEHIHTWNSGSTNWVTYNEIYHKQDCSCGETEYEEHSWNSGVVTTEATHTQEGVMTYTCAVCGETKTETIAKTTEHTYSNWQKCDSTYHQKVCECGETVYEEHSWDSGVVTTEATHIQTGVLTYTCTVCGETKTEAIAKTTAHTYSDWQKCDAMYHQKVCECGDTVYEEHSWDSGVVTTEATHTQEGVMTYTCSVCGATKTDIIEMIEHVYINGKCECGAVDEDYIPDASNFIGNVFQIIGFDLGGVSIVTGTGFVINESGYFITNSHVMEDVYYAYAIFEIPNKTEGDSFTKLSITQGAIYNSTKDIFIGVIDNYSSISEYYNDLIISDEYEIGDTTYSVGYPNGTSYMEVHKGAVVDRTTSFSDKFYGVEFIQSTSYVMFGSSGGILLNDDLEIIGITSRVSLNEDDEFVYSYAISALNFENYVDSVTEYTLYDLAYILHPEYVDYVAFFEWISTDINAIYSLDENYIVSYTFNFTGSGTSDSGYAYTYKEKLIISSDFNISLTDEYYWDNGHYRNISFGGKWTPENGIDDFIFIMEYKFSDAEYYILGSSDINYNENTDLTLLNYYVSSSSSYEVSDDNIAYAKGLFNFYYEYIMGLFE